MVKLYSIPGLESRGELRILNKAPSPKPRTKLRSSSVNIGVLTEAKAIIHEPKSTPLKDNERVWGIRGKSQANCALLTEQKSKRKFKGCLLTIKLRICEVIFHCSNLTEDHKDGSCKIPFQDLQTRAQFGKSEVFSL